MTRRIERTGRCFRCLHTWRMRRRRSQICPRCKSRYYGVPVIKPVKVGNGQGISEVIGPHRDRILELAREAGAEGVWVFGSVRRQEASRGSDLDLLVTWRKNIPLLELARLTAQLESEIGRRVELVDRDALHWAMAPQILSEAVPL